MSTTILNIKVPSVKNMDSPRSGNPVANQYIINTGKEEVFQSYGTIIAVRRFGKDPSIVLDHNSWDYSVTTLKYLKEFLNTSDSKKEIQRLIDSGSYATADLNGGN